MANARSADDSTDSRALAADAQTAMIAEGRRARDPAGRISRPERTPHDGLVDALTMLSGRCLALKTRNRELAREVKQLRAERRRLRSRMAAVSTSQPMQKTRLAQARAAFAREDERRRLDRDLHDGVQNELVALILELSLAEHEPDTCPSLAVILAELGARAQAALDSVRRIARGTQPRLLADFGVVDAVRAQTARASMPVSLEGTAPRSSDEAEAAVYFCCLEAVQNVAKHAGRNAQVILRLHHAHGTLAVGIEDNGRGFDPAHTPEGAGFRNLHDRIGTLGGTVTTTSSPGHGTVLTIALPWPPRQPIKDPHLEAAACADRNPPRETFGSPPLMTTAVTP
jgi:signal transduction histidine kinase